MCTLMVESIVKYEQKYEWSKLQANKSVLSFVGPGRTCGRSIADCCP